MTGSSKGRGWKEVSRHIATLKHLLVSFTCISDKSFLCLFGYFVVVDNFFLTSYTPSQATNISLTHMHLSSKYNNLRILGNDMGGQVWNKKEAGLSCSFPCHGKREDGVLGPWGVGGRFSFL